MLRLDTAIREHEGLIDPRIFCDEDVYREEMDKIFRHTWLYVGHETSIPDPGDYIVNYMGEDEVIVLRDRTGRVRVFLNRCPHRGNKVCLFDRGSQKVFTCTFHGWSFDDEGNLVGQALSREAYGEGFEREKWGLTEVPRVSSYGGLLFAAWDEDMCSLEEYLGDFRVYLDMMLLKPFLGGIEVIPGRGRYMIPINWKAMAENFMSDDYHVPVTHASFFRALAESGVSWWGLGPNWHEFAIQVLVVSPRGVPHACGDVGLWGDPRPGSPYQLQYQVDRRIAQDLGPEAVEWVEERHRRLQEFIARENVPPLYGCANWTIFPNLSLLTGFSAFRGASIIQWHPRGPMRVEAWQWCAVEKEAPEVVKRVAVIYQAADQAPAGMITIDDTENFERSIDMLAAARYHKEERPLNFQSSGDAERWYAEFRKAGFDLGTLPGKALPVLTEETARAYYRYYKELMMRDS